MYSLIIKGTQKCTNIGTFTERILQCADTLHWRNFKFVSKLLSTYSSRKLKVRLYVPPHFIILKNHLNSNNNLKP